MSVNVLKCKVLLIRSLLAAPGLRLQGFGVLFFCFVVAGASLQAADTSKILSQCRALSLADDDVHNCLDNYLDVLDDNLEGIGDFIRAQLSAGPEDTALQAFEASQLAFEDFRSRNCLWYLEFSSPRREAEQIAKNCLASMSEQRLAELQLLVKNQAGNDHVSGYYVYGAERNSFQPCGTDNRFWIEGESFAVGKIQQLYLSRVDTDLQLMFVELAGQIDTEATDTFSGYDGVFNIDSVITLRAPLDSDCSIPGRAGKSAAQTVPTSDNPQAASVAPAEIPASSDTDPQQPEQTLSAYFGDWTASCEQIGSSYGCALKILMTTSKADFPANSPEDAASLIITRRSGQRTVIDLDLPLGLVSGLDDIEQLHWNVDSVEFGALLHSRLESRGPDGAQTHIRQALRERWFIRDNLVPVLKSGKQLSVSVLPGDGNGIVLSATLQGLSRALAFADDFTAAQGEI